MEPGQKKRVKGRHYSINKSDCVGIYNIYDLSRKLQLLKDKQISSSGAEKYIEDNRTLYLYPYCNEETQAASLDVINKGAIELHTLLTIQEVFNIGFKGIGQLTQTKRHDDIGLPVVNIESPPPDPEEFLLLLMARTKDKHSLIVSHSNFMSTFYKYIYDTNQSIRDDGMPNHLKFDNLDIIHLIIDLGVGAADAADAADDDAADAADAADDDAATGAATGTATVHKVLIRTWRDNYRMHNEAGPGAADIATAQNTNTDNFKHVFIMRHCVGCHNTERGISGKLMKIGHYLNPYKTEYGYLKYSICLNNTLGEMREKAKDLYKIMEIYGGYGNYSFGSSVIFRAILTSILQRNALDFYANSQTSGGTKRKTRKSRKKKRKSKYKKHRKKKQKTMRKNTYPRTSVKKNIKESINGAKLNHKLTQ